jgi:tetratricopeptide (TPR) repeat protein
VIVAGLGVVLAAGNGAAQASGVADQEIQKAQALLARGRYEEAIQQLRQADEHNACARCDLLRSESYNQLHDYRHAAESADRALAYAAGDRFLAAEAHDLKGKALLSAVPLGKQGDKRLAEAEEEFRAALALTSALPVAHYYLGVTLLRERRDPEGARELEAYLNYPVPPDYMAQARQLIADPRRAREPFAPEFSFAALGGERISTEALRGKVVLVEFWGTWCHACLAAEPAIAKIYRKFSAQPDGTASPRTGATVKGGATQESAERAFVLLGISSDTDDTAWRAYIAKTKVAWPEYRDEYQRVLRAFSIYYYPTFVVIGPDGIIRYRSSGFGQGSSSEIEDAISRALGNPPSEEEGFPFWWP